VAGATRLDLEGLSEVGTPSWWRWRFGPSKAGASVPDPAIFGSV